MANKSINIKEEITIDGIVDMQMKYRNEGIDIAIEIVGGEV